MNDGPRGDVVIRTPDRRLRVFVTSTLGGSLGIAVVSAIAASSISGGAADPATGFQHAFGTTAVAAAPSPSPVPLDYWVRPVTCGASSQAAWRPGRIAG